MRRGDRGRRYYKYYDTCNSQTCQLCLDSGEAIALEAGKQHLEGRRH